MTTNQELRQASVRAVTGTNGTHEEDWHALFTSDGVAAGMFEERLRSWINTKLGTAYTNINEAMKAYAIDQGATSWNELGSIVISGGSGPTGSGILLEDGTSFLLAEDASYLILE